MSYRAESCKLHSPKPSTLASDEGWLTLIRGTSGGLEGRRKGEARVHLPISLSFRPVTRTLPWLPLVQGGPGSQVTRPCQVHILPLHIYTISKLSVSYSRRSGMNTCVSTTISLASSIQIERFKFLHLEVAEIFYSAKKTLIILPFFNLVQSCILPISEPSSSIDTN